jgi:hypothetical protein
MKKAPQEPSVLRRNKARKPNVERRDVRISRDNDIPAKQTPPPFNPPELLESKRPRTKRKPLNGNPLRLKDYARRKHKVHQHLRREGKGHDCPEYHSKPTCRPRVTRQYYGSNTS